MTARAAFALGLMLLTAGVVRDGFDDWVARTELPPVLAQTSVEVRDRHGALLRAYTVENGRWRLAVTPDAVDAGFIDMLIRYEDKRFASHAGVDPLAMARAAVQSLRAGRIVSGGSTLTMQVARLLENSGTGGWAGKLRQVRVALALERRMGKDDILGLYLLHAPYGGNLEGIRAASLAWFGKEPGRLSPAEAALLVALPQAPETRRPDRHPDAARAARARVLTRLSGQGVLPPEVAELAGVTAVPRLQRAFPQYAPHFADQVRAAAPDQRRHDLTLDAGIQARLEALARTALRGGDPRRSVAILVADHRSGEIVGSVGSAEYRSDWRQGFVDMTQAIRSPGSTLKPLVYALAFDRGLGHPDTLIHDGPVQYGTYAPQNFDGAFRGDVTMRAALVQSLNIPVVKLTQELGPARVMAGLRRAGAAPVLPSGQPGLAVSLGGVGVSLQDLVQLYAGLAQGGVARPLTDRLGEAVPLGARIVSRSAAWQVGHILAGIAPPPGAPAGRVAYKTGTSYGHRDAWAIGWDGAHVIGVWIGRADGTPVPGAFGGQVAAPLLFEAFGRVSPGFAPLPPPPPETLLIGAADLPQPLQRFRARSAGIAQPVDAPVVTFPPMGALLAGAESLTLKLRGGRPPFIVLQNGSPVTGRFHAREIDLPAPGAGFTTLAVIDAAGQSDRVVFQVD